MKTTTDHPCACGCGQPTRGRFIRGHRTDDDYRRAAVEKLWQRVDKTASCWLWTGATWQGYGMLRMGPGKGWNVWTHRLAYELCIGPIPDGYEIDHLCRVRHCVNPAHLEAVTKRDNILRGYGATAVHARQTHCVNGHLLDESNIYRRPDRPAYHRQCRICKKET